MQFIYTRKAVAYNLHFAQFLFLLLAIGLYACGQTNGNKKYIVNPEAKRLNDSAVHMVMTSEDYGKAISLLDEAIKIDSNYFTAFSNKVSFQLERKQYSQAIETAKNLLRIKPEAPDNFVLIGVIYEINGDSMSSNKYFKEAGTRYDEILDTMKVNNKYYKSLMINKSINLILSGQQEKADLMLKQLYNKEQDETYKEMLSYFMNKSKQEIIDSLFQQNGVVKYTSPVRSE